MIDHIGPLDDYADATDRAEATALVALAWTQVLYPFVSVVDFVWMHLYNVHYKRSKLEGLGWQKVSGTFAHNEYSGRLSTFKDVVYGTADVTTKAGLCLIAFLVATRP